MPPARPGAVGVPGGFPGCPAGSEGHAARAPLRLRRSRALRALAGERHRVALAAPLLLLLHFVENLCKTRGAGGGAGCQPRAAPPHPGEARTTSSLRLPLLALWPAARHVGGSPSLLGRRGDERRGVTREQLAPNCIPAVPGEHPALKQFPLAQPGISASPRARAGSSPGQAGSAWRGTARHGAAHLAALLLRCRRPPFPERCPWPSIAPLHPGPPRSPWPAQQETVRQEPGITGRGTRDYRGRRSPGGFRRCPGALRTKPGVRRAKRPAGKGQKPNQPERQHRNQPQRAHVEQGRGETRACTSSAQALRRR